MPQRDLLLPWFSALDNAALALRNRGIGKGEARSRAGELFDRFGLAGFEAARPQELSGGMRQRVAFLRTLVAGKPVLLLDEPFASLDAISRGEMQEWLAGTLSADGRTVLLVSHDLEEALYLADRVLVLSARPGRVVKELRAPDPRAPDRDGAVTDPEFVATREAALRALREGTRAPV
jgi:NitT/TauT family transport system ATP-binding protein